MATFRKRGDKWLAEVYVNDTRKGKSFPTKAQARSWANQMEIDLGKLGDHDSRSHTLSDLFKRYSEEVSENKRGSRWEIARLKAFQRNKIAKRRLMELKREHFENWMSERQKEVAPSTINRELNLLSHCLTQARRWRLMSFNPLQELKRLPTPPARDRRITEQEIDLILLNLSYINGEKPLLKKHRVAIAFLLAIETGMRAGEICSLTPERINKSDRTAFLPITKNGSARTVPLSTKARELIDLLAHGIAPDQPIMQMSSESVSSTFRRAVKRAEIKNLTFHDSRHEAITRLAQKVEVLDLARIVGHKNIKELLTYYNKSAADIAKQLE